MTDGRLALTPRMRKVITAKLLGNGNRFPLHHNLTAALLWREIDVPDWALELGSYTFAVSPRRPLGYFGPLVTIVEPQIQRVEMRADVFQWNEVCYHLVWMGLNLQDQELWYSVRPFTSHI